MSVGKCSVCMYSLCTYVFKNTNPQSKVILVSIKVVGREMR